MEQLHEAVVDQRWERALNLALAEWRTNRAPGLADLIDHVGAKLEVAGVPTEPAEIHAWWRQHAGNPDAVTVGMLTKLLRERVDSLDDSITNVRARWTKAAPSVFQKALSSNQLWPSNFQERFGLMQKWPDDPRVAHALVDIVAKHPPRTYNFPELHDLIADRIGSIGDRRVLPALELMAREPRAGSEPDRQRQVTIAMRAIAALDSHAAPREPGPRLADCLARVAPSPVPPLKPSIDVEPLWQVVCANPDDIGARSVLGDALIELGDPRGDVIVLQCNSRTPGRPLRGRKVEGHDGRVKTLIRKHWHIWLGDLSMAVVRRGSEFRCGLLEVARIGAAGTPPWVYAKAREHRELCAIHTIRPAWVSATDYALFATSLPRFPHTVGADHPNVFEELARLGADLSRLRRIEILPNPITDNRSRSPSGWRSQPLTKSLARISELVPGLRELHVADVGVSREITVVAPELASWFPLLEKATLSKSVVGTGYTSGVAPFKTVD